MERVEVQTLDVEEIITDVKIVESRKLVTMRVIKDLQPIDGADAIEVAIIDGWKVVVKKNEFKVGDPCLYFEIDSFLPEGHLSWQFLVDKHPKMFLGVKGHKLRTIKLRGQVSQGLALHPSEFAEVMYVVADRDMPQTSEENAAALASMRFMLDEGEAALSMYDLDWTGVLGVSKYEPPIPANMQGKIEGLFPSFIPKTDEERCQNIPNEIFGYLPQIIPASIEHGRPEIIRPARADRNAQYEISLKLDGSSMTAFVVKTVVAVVDDGISIESTGMRVGVCSRNLELSTSEANQGNSFVRALYDTGLNVALEVYFSKFDQEIAVQGELMGPGIQGNREGLMGPILFVYKIYNITEQRYMTQTEREKAFDFLLAYSPTMAHVPVLYSATTLDQLGIKDIDGLLKFAEGPSLKHAVREGLVFKRKDGLFSFKVISNKFLEKEKD